MVYCNPVVSVHKYLKEKKTTYVSHDLATVKISAYGLRGFTKCTQMRVMYSIMHRSTYRLYRILSAT